MDDLQRLAPILAALQRIATESETHRAVAVDTLDQRFDTLLHEEVRKAGEIAEPVTVSHIIPFPVTTPASVKLSEGEVSGTSGCQPVALAKRLIICKPLPDELFQGWLGRMRAINCKLDNASIVKWITAEACHQGTQAFLEPDPLQDAATILEVSRDSLLRLHTLTPFFNALEGLKPSKLGTKSAKHRAAYERKAPLRLDSKFPRYCQHCAQAEFLSEGYSYWHRCHQLPGMIWCPEHGTQLATVARQDVFEQCPHEISDSFFDERRRTLTEAQTIVLRRYSQLAHHILALAPAIDSAVASKVLGEGARASNLRISKEGTRPTLSNRIIELLPSWWLSETLPRVRWVPGGYISTIDAACVAGATRYTTTTLCLIAALLYEEPDEVILRVLADRTPVQEKIQGFDFWARKAIFDEYVAHRGVVSRIADKLALPHSTVALGLLNQGLPGLGKTRASTTLSAIRAFLEGLSLAEASAGNQALVAEMEALLRVVASKFKIAIDAILGESDSHDQPSSLKGRKRAAR